MDLTIDQSCPSCGAPIVVNEDDKLIECGFCNVTNFRLESTAARYLLPYSLPEDVDESEMIFVPYLRFKGVVYFVENYQVRYKIVDTTRLAVEIQSLLPSLGLRPQVMKVHPVTVAVQGRFVLQTVPVKAAFLQATKLVELFSGKNNKKLLHRAFIGETISLIYQPFYIKDDYIIDAVDKRRIGPAGDLLALSGKSCSSKKSWEPHFISTRCPECGGLLKGERDSCVLCCDNCSIHWAEEKSKLVRIQWSVAEHIQKNIKYFPFWKIKFTTTGCDLTNFGNLIRFTNQPIVLSRNDRQEPLYFLLPAFKINPKAFLQIASQLTMAHGKIPKGKTIGGIMSHPVTLDKGEAIQSIKSILVNLTVGNSKQLQLLPQVTVEVSRCELLFLPFVKNVHDYIQIHTPASLQVAAVRYGRSL
ncbi:MAG: hypothetical protein ACI8ZB_001040 [Desulforhopalus sp.]|jgi:hypothetical protein